MSFIISIASVHSLKINCHKVRRQFSALEKASGLVVYCKGVSQQYINYVESSIIWIIDSYGRVIWTVEKWWKLMVLYALMFYAKGQREGERGKECLFMATHTHTVCPKNLIMHAHFFFLFSASSHLSMFATIGCVHTKNFYLLLVSRANFLGYCGWHSVASF